MRLDLIPALFWNFKKNQKCDEEAILAQYAEYPCSFGFFRIGEESGAVISIDIEKEALNKEPNAPSALLDQTAGELSEYLAGRRTQFSFPYRLQGTPFRMKVWHELENVSYGETTTYKKLAEAIGRAGAYHAVGGAVAANPLSIVVPCHRVIGTNGTLTGYAWGLPIKERLLALERKEMDRMNEIE